MQAHKRRYGCRFRYSPLRPQPPHAGAFRCLNAARRVAHLYQGMTKADCLRIAREWLAHARTQRRAWGTEVLAFAR